MADTDLIPYAMWTDDCQGKKDYDGELLTISTRYWPGPPRYGEMPSANSEIHLNIGPKRESGGCYDWRVWREAEFQAPTEAEVKAQVEAWVTQQMADVVALLGGISAFKEP